MLKKILLGAGLTIALVTGGILAAAAAQPDSFEVKRTTTINAPAAAIAPYLTDYRKFVEWSPFEKFDPAMKKTYGGPATGKGATYGWEGNDHAGKGNMEITAVTPTEVTMKLDFEKPFAAHNQVVFTLAPKDGATDVTWAMNGPQPFVAKVMCVFMSMDKMVGKDFEEGLATLKGLAEKK